MCQDLEAKGLIRHAGGQFKLLYAITDKGTAYLAKTLMLIVLSELKETHGDFICVSDILLKLETPDRNEELSQAVEYLLKKHDPTFLVQEEDGGVIINPKGEEHLLESDYIGDFTRKTNQVEEFIPKFSQIYNKRRAMTSTLKQSLPETSIPVKKSHTVKLAGLLKHRPEQQIEKAFIAYCDQVIDGKNYAQEEFSVVLYKQRQRGRVFRSGQHVGILQDAI